jgi:hypothetical protein
MFTLAYSNNRVAYSTSCNLAPTSSSRLYMAEVRILIQGTKNAYTTIRAGDVVYYKIEAKDVNKEKVRALGVLTPTKMVAPLCVREDGDEEFYIDVTQKPLSVEAMIKNGSLLRIVSADKVCFLGWNKRYRSMP